jgi:hypothetical protein
VSTGLWSLASGKGVGADRLVFQGRKKPEGTVPLPFPRQGTSIVKELGPSSGDRRAAGSTPDAVAEPLDP